MLRIQLSAEEVSTLMKRLLFVAIYIFSSGLLAQDLLSPGDTLKKVYRVTEPSLGGTRLLHSIPLPPDDWLVVRTENYEASIKGGGSERIPMRTVSLAQVSKDNQVSMAAFIRSNASSQRMRWTDEPCKGSDLLFMNNFGGGIWNQKCLTIRLETYLQTNNAVQNRSREFLSAKGIKYAANIITANIYRLDDKGGYLFVSIFLFPDRYDFENPIESVLARHPWHASLFKADPEKVKFINAYAKWAESYAETIFKLYDNPTASIEEVKMFSYPRGEK